MGTCGTCKHWGKISDTTGWNDGVWVASNTDTGSLRDDPTYVDRLHAMQSLYRTCTKVKIGGAVDFEGPEGPPLAFTIDASEYRADLRTRAEFGCVLHEPGTPA